MRVLLLAIFCFSTLLLTGCEPNPVIRVQSVNSTVFADASNSQMLGNAIAHSKIVSGSEWEYAKRSFTYLVGGKVEIDKSAYEHLNLGIKKFFVGFAFVCSKPETNTSIEMSSEAYIEILTDKGRRTGTSRSRSWLTAIVNSDNSHLEKLLRDTL